MTAEVGVINRRGVALAADSAVTISKADGSAVTLNNAEKVFSLYSSNYVGMMIFNDANFMGIPWEVLINSYKEKIGNQVKPHLKDYVTSFLKYINELDIYTEGAEATFVANNIYAVLNELPDPSQDLEDIENALYQLEKDTQNQILLKVDLEQFTQEYSDLVSEIFNSKYGQEYSELIPLFTKVVAEIISSDAFLNSYTGLVVAGYGSSDLFPTVYELQITGRFNGQIKYKQESYTSVEPLKGNASSAIMPFAQHEMVDTVLRGIDPNLKDFLGQQLNDIYQKIVQYTDQNLGVSDQTQNLDNYVRKVIERRYAKFEDIIKYNFSDPIVSMLDNLSLQELGQMADTLVNLTSFKRKYSGDIRTVGGPVDVLVLSREDGPVWLKKKDTHTFD